MRGTSWWRLRARRQSYLRMYRSRLKQVCPLIQLFLLSEVLHAWRLLATSAGSALPRKGMSISGVITDLQVNGCRCSWVKRWVFRLPWCDMDAELAWRWRNIRDGRLAAHGMRHEMQCGEDGLFALSFHNRDANLS